MKQQGKLDEAIASYRKAIELKLESFEVYTNLGIALQSQSKIDEAITAYRKAIELQPSHYVAYNNLASILATAPPRTVIPHAPWSWQPERPNWGQRRGRLGTRSASPAIASASGSRPSRRLRSR